MQYLKKNVFKPSMGNPVISRKEIRALNRILKINSLEFMKIAVAHKKTACDGISIF
jgi:hypothetical protein